MEIFSVLLMSSYALWASAKNVFMVLASTEALARVWFEIMTLVISVYQKQEWKWKYSYDKHSYCVVLRTPLWATKPLDKKWTVWWKSYVCSSVHVKAPFIATPVNISLSLWSLHYIMVLVTETGRSEGYKSAAIFHISLFLGDLSSQPESGLYFPLRCVGFCKFAQYW